MFEWPDFSCLDDVGVWIQLTTDTWDRRTAIPKVQFELLGQGPDGIEDYFKQLQRSLVGHTIHHTPPPYKYPHRLLFGDRERDLGDAMKIPDWFIAWADEHDITMRHQRDLTFLPDLKGRAHGVWGATRNRDGQTRRADVDANSDVWWEQLVRGNLPEGTVIPCGLTFDVADLGEGEKESFCIPDDVTIKGHLRLIGFSHLRDLPANLTVMGDLELRGAQIRRLPDGLNVEGILDLAGNAYPVEIPPGTQVRMWIEGGK